jgi:hypothetical protein
MRNKNNAIYAFAIFLAALVILVFRTLSPQPATPDYPTNTRPINTEILYVDTSNNLVADYTYGSRQYTLPRVGFDTNGKYAVYNEVVDGVVSSRVTWLNLATSEKTLLPVNNCRFPTINDNSTLVACVSMGKIQLINLTDMSVEAFFGDEMDLPQGAPQFMGDYLVFLSQRREESVFVIADTATRGVVGIVPNDNNIIFSPNAEYYVNVSGAELTVRYREGKKLITMPAMSDLDAPMTVIGWDDTSTRIFVNVAYSIYQHGLVSFDIHSGEVFSILTESSAFVSASTLNNQLLYSTVANDISVKDLQTGETQYVGYGTNAQWLK